MKVRPLSFPFTLALSVFAAISAVWISLQAIGNDWPAYLGDRASSQYSALDTITSENVGSLQMAWTYRSGDARTDNRSQIQCNPLVIDGVLYGITPGLRLFALNAATGTQLWTFDPWPNGEGSSQGVSRGLVFWKATAINPQPSNASATVAPEAQNQPANRILWAAGSHLYAIDPATGKPMDSFGDQGRIDLRKDLGRESSGLFLQTSTPGVLFENLLILGMRLGEGPAPAAPGPIRAYDVLTGQLAWRFNTIPMPGEFGHETWPPDAHTHIGGANVWTGFALDEQRGLVFCPTGAAAFDFWGGNRIGENLFANCLIALDARTGRRVWHYQFVRHDLWDRDLPAPPNLLTVQREGRHIDAVAQVTKSGHIFVFNRETGEPLFPIQEVPVPPSDLQGEVAWPTQPLPLKPEPFSRQVFSYSEISDVSPASHRAILDQFSRLRPHTPFVPPSTEGTIVFPGFDGGAEWGGAAVDPSGVLYVNANEMPWILTMVPTKADPDGSSSSGRALYTQICAACHGMDRLGNPAQNVPALVQLADRLQKADVLTLLQTGRGVMPSFAFLNEAQMEAIIEDMWSPQPTADPGVEVQIEARVEVADQPKESSTSAAAKKHGAGALGTIPYSHTGYNRWLDPDGYPAVKPPWGTLNAIDLNTGEYRWRVTLGEFSELTARGIPPTGTENYGGPVVTAGNVLFIAASKDEHIRAFDTRDGRELWKARLPAGGYATPAVYSVGGRQFVVIACGGGKMGTPSGDAYVAFALPE